MTKAVLVMAWIRINRKIVSFASESYRRAMGFEESQVRKGNTFEINSGGSNNRYGMRARSYGDSHKARWRARLVYWFPLSIARPCIQFWELVTS
jgi:hypothetical protein